MEAFESFVAVALETEGFVVSSAVKFPVTRKTKKASYDEVQTHGYEVDLVAARANRLVLATVKSFFGSRGVAAEHVTGNTGSAAAKGYALLNDPIIRDGVVASAAARYGYPVGHVQVRLYVGRFAASKKKRHHEPAIRAWCGSRLVGAGPIEVYGLDDVIGAARYANTATTLCLSP